MLSKRSALRLVFFLAPTALIAATAIAFISSEPSAEVETGYSQPVQSDWIDCGPIFTAGKEGEWDRYMWGGFANTVVKKDGVFYLYYQGASGYDDQNGTVTWRAIGVATSSTGLAFTKYAQNPVLTWFPNDNLEEGAVSGGAFLDGTGSVAIYYGANSWAGGGRVTADGRFATSSDGYTFVDQGIALDHSDIFTWGWGDELFPIIGFHSGEEWFSYYIPNGTLQEGQLGVAWGDDPLHLSHSSAARAGGKSISVWGPGSIAQLGTEVYALFLNNLRAPNGHVMEVRTVSAATPDELSAPLVTYRFDNVRQASVLLDSATNRWFLFYRSAEQEYYGVMVAAAEGGHVDCAGKREYLPVIRSN